MKQRTYFLGLIAVSAFWAAVAAEAPTDRIAGDLKARLLNIFEEESGLEQLRRLAIEIGYSPPVWHDGRLSLGGRWSLWQGKDGKLVLSHPDKNSMPIPKEAIFHRYVSEDGVTEQIGTAEVRMVIVGTADHLVLVHPKGVAIRVRRAGYAPRK